MKFERYELKAERSLMFFEFISEGSKGKITKLVEYAETNLKGFYNLGFGDKDHTTGKIDDTAITNNGDSQKVLATVASTVYAFTDKYPDAWIYATGNTKVRTRLYRIGITNNLADILQDFEIYGLKNGEWMEFEKNTDFDAFLVRRKNQ
jgi:Family of unknown function (DUF6934)